MTKFEKAELVSSYLDEILPNASCELNYHQPYELLIAVVLSAQTTDKAVNKVTDILFSTYPTLSSLEEASFDDVIKIIAPIGLAKNKAKALKDIVHKLINEYDGQVPKDKDILKTFTGVGNKTAGVVLMELYKVEAIPVDTHIHRISSRLGFSKKSDTPDEVERKLEAIFPKEKWSKMHHQLIHFGRYYCLARNPNCNHCKLKPICKEKLAK